MCGSPDAPRAVHVATKPEQNQLVASDNPNPGRGEVGRVIDTRYPDIARHAASLTQRSPIADRWTLTVDATGVGRAFCDVLDEWHLKHTRVQMTGGWRQAVRGGSGTSRRISLFPIVMGVRGLA